MSSVRRFVYRAKRVRQTLIDSYNSFPVTASAMKRHKQRARRTYQAEVSQLTLF